MWICNACTTSFSVGAPQCPQCDARDARPQHVVLVDGWPAPNVYDPHAGETPGTEDTAVDKNTSDTESAQVTGSVIEEPKASPAGRKKDTTTT